MDTALLQLGIYFLRRNIDVLDAMKLTVIEDEPKSLIIEFDGVDRGIAELIKDRLIENKDVEFAGVIRMHPEVGKPRLVVKSGKSARSIVLKAVESAEEEIKELALHMPKK